MCLQFTFRKQSFLKATILETTKPLPNTQLKNFKAIRFRKWELEVFFHEVILAGRLEIVPKETAYVCQFKSTRPYLWSPGYQEPHKFATLIYLCYL